MKTKVQKLFVYIQKLPTILRAILLTSVFAISLPTMAKDDQIEIGHPNKILDAMDWITPQSLISKALLWNKDIDSHQISPETISIVRQYLDDNDMKEVKVRVNQYNPKGEWKRLVANKKVGAGWRYSVGALSVLGYTLVPNRIVGGDHYNPYTNTINLFSDNFAVALHEASHAKDQKSRKYKGAYAASYSLPGASLYHEAESTSDVISYLEQNGSPEQVAAARKVLYPAYGTYVGALSDEPTVQLATVLAGHVIARSSAATKDSESPDTSITQGK